MVKKTKKIYNLVAVIGIAVSVFLSFPQKGLTDTASDNANKIKDLEEKAETYRKLIEMKQKQQGSLNNQLSIMEAEDKKLETEITIKENELEDVGSQVERLTGQITEYEKSIQSQKLILADLIRAYYETKEGSPTLDFLSGKNFYSVMRSGDSIIQAEEKVGMVVDNIISLKNNLEQEKQIFEQKQNEIADLTSQLNDKNDTLDNNKAQKQNLLQVTKGEEAKYQELLAKVEKQKEELLNIDELSTAGGFSADAYDKPSSGLASTSWYYSQKDSRWGNDEIGKSKSKMKDWGCAVTSVAMIFKYYGSSVTPKQLADSSKYFSWDLIKWPTVWSDIELISSISHGNISWTTIDGQLKKGNPVIVYIKKTNNRGGHYVVIHHKLANGKYIVHDPYFGANLYLDTSRALVGKMGTDSGTKIDQMIIYNK